MRKSIMDKRPNCVYVYLNKHPRATIRELRETFGDIASTTISAYHSYWRKYVRPLLFLYQLMAKKFELKRPLSKNEAIRMRSIERFLGLRE